MTQLWEISATELVGAFRAGTASPVEAVSSCLERIRECDQVVGAFTSIAEELALTDARKQETAYLRGEAGARLAGVPVAVKELFEVSELPFTGCSATRSGVVGRFDAAVVRSLREAGAIVIGTTRTHELGWGITTQHEDLGGTGNPWRVDRVPGGSSGGSAAAASYGAVPLALGSDTGGSVRIPAAFCGIVGFKPTYRRVPTERMLPLAPAFDHVGFLAREVADIADALGASVASSTNEGLRIGTPVVPAGVPLAPAVSSALETALEASGSHRDVDLPDPAHVAEVFATMQLVQALHVHRTVLETWPSKADEYGSDVRARLERAASVSGDDYDAASAALGEVRTATLRAFEQVDVVLHPVSAGGPSSIETPDEVVHLGARLPLRDVVMPCTVLHNLVGIPACTIPAGLDDDGVPVGIQVAAGPGADDLVLTVAAFLRDALRSRLPKWPPVLGAT